MIHVHWGRPIEPAEFESLSDEELVALVEERIRDCHARARRSRLRAMGIEPRCGDALLNR